MTIKTIIVLLIGTGAMLLPILLLSWRYGIKLWKGIPISFILTVTGTLGTYVWFFVENFWFGGRSFYGAVFLVPLAFLYVARLFHVEWGELLDLCAPAECVMLAIMKYQCLVDNCCRGRELFVGASESMVFPSQAVEMANALMLFMLLVILAFFSKNRGTIYPWYLISYGISRFILNFFREEWALYDGGIPPLGTVWSVVAVIVGIAWLHNSRKKQPMAV